LEINNVMSFDRFLLQRVRRCGRGIVGFLALGSSLALAQDANRFFVTRDGQKHGMLKSDTEYGATLRSHRDADAVAKRLSLTGQGKLEPSFGSSQGKVRLVRVSKTSIAGREALRLDPGVSDIRPVYRFQAADAPVITTGEILVRVRADLSEARRQQLWSDYHIQNVEPFEGFPDVYVLGPLTHDEDEVLVAEALADDDRTVWAQPELRLPSTPAQLVADPLINYQWHLNNTGQLGGPEGADIDAFEAWTITRGAGVLVGMRDDSCDAGHPDLVENYAGFGQDVKVPVNSAGFDNPSPKSEGDAHGPAVMGLAVARGNGLGGRGVAPEAKFTASRSPFGFEGTLRETAGTYSFALAHNVDVHINSWSYTVSFPTPELLVDSITRAFNEGRRRADVNGDGEPDPLGMVVVFASGNQARQLFAGFGPSTHPEVIGVGASDDLDRRADFSNYGDTIDVLAPGNGEWRAFGGIFTTDARDELVGQGYNVGGFYPTTTFADVEASGNYTASFNGTSAACPIAAGVATLVLSVNPRLRGQDQSRGRELPSGDESKSSVRLWPDQRRGGRR
jgi:hypothetical protein